MSTAVAAAASSAADWQNKLLRADKIHENLLYIHTRYKRTYSTYIYIYKYIFLCRCTLAKRFPAALTWPRSRAILSFFTLINKHNGGQKRMQQDGAEGELRHRARATRQLVRVEALLCTS